MRAEVWKDISGYEGRYQVSDFGRVRSLVYPKANGPVVLAGCLTGKGYLSVSLYPGRNNGKRGQTFMIYTLVAETFLGPKPNPYADINHKDGNKKNDSLENLEYCSHVENIRHAKRSGLLKIGERHPCATISDETARSILSACSSGKTTREIADAHGTSLAVVYSIRKRRGWTHIHN